MNKKILLFLTILTIIFLLIFFVQKSYKTIKTGNNISKSNEDLIEYIFNISSYEAKLNVTIYSNKTVNQYELEQYYLKSNYSKQIVKAPQNIQNLEMIYNGANLEIRNTNLGLNKIYENYSDLNNNMLWLNYFVENYKEAYDIEENENEIIIKTKLKNNCQAMLYINAKTSLPIKIEVIDNNKIKVYIEYKEIKLNNIQENNI